MRDDLGQLLWIGFQGTRAPAAVRDRIAAGAVGATILFKRNLAIGDAGCDLDALVALNAELHGAAPDGTPALILEDSVASERDRDVLCRAILACRVADGHLIGVRP